MRHPRLWLPLFLSLTTALACAEALTGPDAAPESETEMRAATAARVPRGPLSFQALAPGDVVVVDIDAHGCFHHDVFNLQIAVEVDGTLVLSGTDTFDGGQPGAVAEIQRFEAQRLAPSEVAGLDRMLAYYRAGPGDGCTEYHTIRLRQVREGATYREEAYVDGSCGMLEADSIVSFASLLWKQRQQSRQAAG